MGDAKMELPSLRKVTTSAEPSVNAAPEESCGDRLLRMIEKKCNLEQPQTQITDTATRAGSLFFFAIERLNAAPRDRSSRIVQRRPSITLPRHREGPAPQQLPRRCEQQEEERRRHEWGRRRAHCHPLRRQRGWPRRGPRVPRAQRLRRCEGSGCALAAHQLSTRYALRSTQTQRAACARKHTPVCFLWTPLGR